MCFITPNRLRCGKASTIWVVDRGPFRNKSRIERRVLSDNAFHTASSSSSGRLAPFPDRIRRAILGDSIQRVLPASDYLPMRLIDEADRAMA